MKCPNHSVMTWQLLPCEYTDFVYPNRLSTGSPKDKLNVSFESHVFSLCPAPFFTIMVLGTTPLNHRFGKGDEISLPSVAKAPVRGSTELKRTRVCALLHVTMPHSFLRLHTAVSPMNSVQALLGTQGISSLVPHHKDA